MIMLAKQKKTHAVKCISVLSKIGGTGQTDGRRAIRTVLNAVSYCYCLFALVCYCMLLLSNEQFGNSATSVKSNTVSVSSLLRRAA